MEFIYLFIHLKSN